jgi:N-acetylneuraminic acid mutarotase
MNQPRRSFGCYVTNSHIYVAGGLYASFSATSSCEVYDIEKNTWSELPSLPQPNFSLALSIFKKNHLIAVGGTDEQKRPLNSIWILNLVGNNKWQRINVALSQAVSEVGLF